MSTRSKTSAEKKADRVARDRARRYEARAAFHDKITRRRRIDDIAFTIGGLVIIAAAITTQTLYYSAGPGSVVPAPEPTVGITDAPVIPQEILPTLLPLSDTTD